MAKNFLENALKFSFACIIITVAVDILYRIIATTKLTLTHLGSGTFKTSATEEPIFEYTCNEPFTFTGYVNLKNMEDGDTVVLRQYVKLAINGEYTLYAEEEYVGKQREPLIHIEKLPALKAIKITVQQTSGSFKYLPWEFYAGKVG